MPEEKILIETEFCEISHLDYLFILHIKKLRESHDMTQQELSKKMGVSKSFVGNVESFVQRHKYSIRHITLLAKAFQYESLAKLMDFETPKYDIIKLTLKVTKAIKENGKVRNKSVEVIELSEVQ
ncbi:helix-turn-helix domain-containing protein [Zunongwangia profunda]|jgi:transcriptional regulator with XRE-family HTH domain|uniref:helix-turn-helix domain-containing protein n=1 Tax=Zunongwangia profunda TaxID=398743 RepID=UPI001D18B053|nr:helix-turn-helix transcriptional regulator [Zunongwangia profunda]MCC4228617.1 helix-turn-helix transcriptional regulator [Zunongwangia profunda]|tara:strand:- start:223 stop:597 length:375 start_codon:yes stop_codon:yes gene_type:complete